MNDACLQAWAVTTAGGCCFSAWAPRSAPPTSPSDLILSLDLGRMHVRRPARLFEMLGDEGFEKLGPKKWQKVVHESCRRSRTP